MLFQEEKSVVHFHTAKFGMDTVLFNKKFKQTWKLHLNEVFLKYIIAFSIMNISFVASHQAYGMLTNITLPFKTTQYKVTL